MSLHTVSIDSHSAFSKASSRGFFENPLDKAQKLCYNITVTRCSAGGSAPVSGTGGREFESRHFDQYKGEALASPLYWSQSTGKRSLQAANAVPFFILSGRLDELAAGEFGVQSPATSTILALKSNFQSLFFDFSDAKFEG